MTHSTLFAEFKKKACIYYESGLVGHFNEHPGNFDLSLDIQEFLSDCIILIWEKNSGTLLEPRTKEIQTLGTAVLTSAKGFLMGVKLPHSLEAANPSASIMNHTCAYPCTPAMERNSSLSILVLVDNYQRFAKPYVRILVINRYPGNLLWRLNDTRPPRSHHLC